MGCGAVWRRQIGRGGEETLLANGEGCRVQGGTL